MQWSVTEKQGKDQKRKTTQTKKSREGKVVEMLLSSLGRKHKWKRSFVRRKMQLKKETGTSGFKGKYDAKPDATTTTTTTATMMALVGRLLQDQK